MSESIVVENASKRFTMQYTKTIKQMTIAALRRRYAGRGVHLVRVGEAFAFRTAADLGHLMAREAVETRKLSRAAMETLAIVAYHQPVTRAEIEEGAQGSGHSPGAVVEDVLGE